MYGSFANKIMKFLVMISVTTALLFSYTWRGGCVVGQSFENPQQHFQTFEFDATLRGSFNISECAKELINCFEMVRPDVICETIQSGYEYLRDSVCGVMRTYCHDYYGNFDSYGNRFEIYEQYCRKHKDQHWT